MSVSLRSRFWSKVDASGDCWLWTASLIPAGYGQFYMKTPDGRDTMARAHRVSWEFLVGEIPDGLTLDHLCRVRHCVNPDHLDPVTRGENLLRSHATITRQNQEKTHCPHGHPYSGENLYVDPSGGRRCRTCAESRDRARVR